jgi:hypothetical protein
MSRTEVVEKIKTQVLCPITFFRKSYVFWGIVEKYCRAGQATDDNAAHAHCLLDNRIQTQSEYVMIVAFTLQQLLHGHASMLCYNSALPALLNNN